MIRNVIYVISFFLILFVALGVKTAYTNAKKPSPLVGESKDSIWYATYSLDDDGHDIWTGLIERKKSDEYKLKHLYFSEDGMNVAESDETSIGYYHEDTNDFKHKYAEFVVHGRPPEKDVEYAVKVQWVYKGKEYEEIIPLNTKE